MLKLLYFDHLMQRANHWKRLWCWKRLKAGREGHSREWEGWMASPTKWTWVWTNLGDGEGQEWLACWSPWDHKELDTTEWLNNNNMGMVGRRVVKSLKSLRLLGPACGSTSSHVILMTSSNKYCLNSILDISHLQRSIQRKGSSVRRKLMILLHREVWPNSMLTLKVH